MNKQNIYQKTKYEGKYTEENFNIEKEALRLTLKKKK